MDAKLAVLAVQTRLLGNTTYALLLRQLFADSPDIEFRARWGNETRAIVPRLVNRLCIARGQLTPKTINADFWGTRYEFGASFVADRVLRSALAERPADVLHLHTQCLAWHSVGTMRRIPTVISADMTAMQAAVQETIPAMRWTHRPRMAFEGRVFRAAAAVVAFSRYAADSIVAGHGIDRSRVTVIHPGIRQAEFAALRPERSADAACRLLFVGGEFDRKGGPLLLDVFRTHLAATGASLDIVTQSDVRADLPHVRVHRDVTPFSPRWRELYERASMLVVPTYRDASSLVSIEAMAAGLPVVTGDVGGIPEIVTDGESGFLIAPGDGALLARRLATLIADPALRARMGDAGRGRVTRDFDATVNAARLARVYHEAFQTRREPRRMALRESRA